MGQFNSNLRNSCMSSSVFLCLDRTEREGTDGEYFNDASEKPIQRNQGAKDRTRPSTLVESSSQLATDSPYKEEQAPVFEVNSSFGRKQSDKSKDVTN